MNTEVLRKIDAVERAVLADMPPSPGIVIPVCLAQAVRDVLEATWNERAKVGGVAGRAKACATFLEECISAQANHN
jgi:hypothetical protein